MLGIIRIHVRTIECWKHEGFLVTCTCTDFQPFALAYMYMKVPILQGVFDHSHLN